LRLRRAGVLVARRGRLGGYRLACSPGELSLAAVLIGLGEAAGARSQTETTATDKVTRALERSLGRARLQALEDLRLEDLLFDLQSAEAGATSEAGLLLG
ncbi:MAG: Rrf2 family transcriptional regulator, partial [Cyanobacteria bacterium]|nr:Rrf2 family transcriptional regulator [Cyanobacteriota bacterium]